MKRLSTRLLVSALLVSSTAYLACSSNDESGKASGAGGTSTGGSSGAVGGASAAGGTNGTVGGATNAQNGGSVALGGSNGSSGGSGVGSASNGGASMSGGSGNSVGGAATGGSKAAGGTEAAGGTKAGNGGGANGGAAAVGGKANGGSSALGGASAQGGANAGGSAHSGAWKVMPLGDSITAATCYPQLVSKNLRSTGHTNFQFVGTQTNNQSCGATSVTTEGHGGYLVTYLTMATPPSQPACNASTCGKLSELKTWAAEKPDAVFMHFGTNDAWNGKTDAQILAAYGTVVSEFRSQNPNVIFFVAQIIPMNVTSSTCSGCSCPNCGSIISSLDSQLPTWANSNATSSSPIYVVDLNTGFSATSDTSDGVHPNPAGSQKMADKMAPAIVAHLDGI